LKKNPIIQYALDVTTIEEAKKLAHYGVEEGVDWLEIGNPLIKFEGVRSLKSLREAFPNKYILADFMILSGSRRYIDIAKEYGVNNITVTALAPDETVKEAIELCEKNNLDCTVDLFHKENLLDNAKKYEEMGADYVMVHYGVDQKRLNLEKKPLKSLKEVVEHVNIPVSYATYDFYESKEAVDLGASVIVQGEPLLTSVTPQADLKKFIENTKGKEENDL